MNPQRPDCEACRDLHDGEPPCPQCDKPREDLWPEGEIAFKIWASLDKHERQFWPVNGAPLPLSLEAVRAVVADYGLGREAQELVLALEDKALEMRLAEHGRQNGRGVKG